MSLTSILSRITKLSRKGTRPPQGERETIIRNAVLDDFDLIADILANTKNHFFGSSGRLKCSDVHCFFADYATHRILVIEKYNTGEEVAIGYAEFAHFPILQALPTDSWKYWLKHHFCLPFTVNAENVLFFNFFVFQTDYMPHVLNTVLTECFQRENKLRYILVVQMPEDPINEQYFHILEDHSNVFYPRDFNVTSCKNTQILHVIYRETIVPNLRSRFALPEDNDDCVEIIDKYQPDRRDKLGDFYIAEELLGRTSKKEYDKLIVMENANETAGFVWISSKADVMFFLTNFELDDFGHLLKYNRRLPRKTVDIPLIYRDKTAQQLLFTPAYLDEQLLKAESILQQFSTTSIGSRYLLHVVSNSGIITISQDNFLAVASTIKKFHSVDNLLRSINYYTAAYKRYVPIKFNITETDNCEQYKKRKTKFSASDSDDSSEEYDECMYAYHRVQMMAHSNVFQLKLYGLNDTIDIRQSIQIIITAFNANTERDYCVIRLKSSTEMSDALHELLQYFIEIPPRPNCETTDILYLTYRGAIFGDLSVQLMEPEDIQEVEKILCADPNAVHEIARVREIINEVFETDNPEGYTIATIRNGNGKSLKGSIIVGYAILMRFTHMHELQEHFYLRYSYRLDEKYGELVTLKLHPCFRFKSNLVFRELACLTDLWCLYYMLPFKNKPQTLTNDLWNYMQPMEPRHVKKIIYERNKQRLASQGRMNYRDDYFALFCNNLFPIKQFTILDTIVILGFTNMTKAFLRTLIFQWDAMSSKVEMNCCLPRLKVIVIAEPGLVQAEFDQEFACVLCDNPRVCWVNCQNWSSFIRDATKRIDLRIWIEFISGRVREIDIRRSIVKVDKSCEVYFNKLILLSDTEFGPPHKSRMIPVHIPPNYAHVNNRFDKMVLYHKLRILLEDCAEPRILIYGGHPRTFEFINFLIEHGVKGNCITLVLPYLLTDVTESDTLNVPSQDANIEPILIQMAEDLNVNVYDEYNFTNWKYYNDEESIKYVTFNRNITNERLEINCDLFVSYHENFMSVDFEKVLKRSDITVHHGKIIVDNCYRTSAPNVYALGRYIEHRDETNHQYSFVSPNEATRKLLHILKLTDPDMDEDDTEFDEKYSKAHYFQAQLPFNYYMANMTIPKRYIANHLPNSYNATLVTYDGDFCRVRLNPNGIVEQILCVVKKNICLDFLKFFIGKHETLLNNLRGRWYTDEIDSFLHFFQEPWTELILHDDYEELHKEIVRLITPQAKGIMDLGLERNFRKDMFRRHLTDVGITREVHNLVLNFVRTRRNEFTDSFALPEDFLEEQIV